MIFHLIYFSFIIVLLQVQYLDMKPHLQYLLTTCRRSWPPVTTNHTIISSQSTKSLLRLTHKMIPRILVNNIQYIKKCILVSVCFYLVEHIPSVDRMIMVTQAPDISSSVNTTTVIEPAIDTTDEGVNAGVTNTTEEPHLILLWTEYQMIGKNIYKTIFSRISNNECPISNCRFTTDRSLQNQSSAIIFHMPNLHWENYTYPQYR